MTNQDIDSREYNGWPNRSTWNLVLWRSNEEYTEKEYERIVANAAKEMKALGVFSGVALRAKLGEDYLKELKSFYAYVWRSYARTDCCIWRNIKWDAVFDTFIEDVGYAIKG